MSLRIRPSRPPYLAYGARGAPADRLVDLVYLDLVYLVDLFSDLCVGSVRESYACHLLKGGGEGGPLHPLDPLEWCEANPDVPRVLVAGVSGQITYVV